jgi:hypothetical protein
MKKPPQPPTINEEDEDDDEDTKAADDLQQKFEISISDKNRTVSGEFKLNYDQQTF